MPSDQSPYLKHLFVCVNKRDPGVTCCAAGGLSGAASSSGSHAHGGGEAIREKLKSYVKEHGLKCRVRISASGCMDLCAQGPNVMVYPDYRWYHPVTLEDVDKIIEEHLAPLVTAAQGETGGKLSRGDSGAVAPGNDTIRAFLFDLGNVLIRFDHRIAAQRIAAATGTDPEVLYRLFFESPLVIAHDEGRISTRRFYEGLKEEIGLKVSYEEFLWSWNDIFTDDPEATKLIKRLLPQYPCFLISNTNRAHFDYCRKRFPILNELSGWILSFEVGALKPHPAIYRRALEVLQLPASQILYVDDRQDLIEVGQTLGFQTHPFLNTASLAEELKTRGILSSEVFIG